MIPSYLSQGPSPSSIPPSPSTSSLLTTSNELSNSNSTTTPLSITKSFRPYYSPIELVELIRLQASARGLPEEKKSGSRKELSDARVETLRQVACGFIERVGGRLGFPRRTIATAQTLYHRFHLHFHLQDFASQDVSISALLVASKLEDTLKKLREIQNAAWQVDNMVRGGDGMGEGDTNTQESHRTQLIAIERLILQTICFNFNLHRSPTVPTPEQLLGGANVLPEEQAVGGKDVFGWVVRFGRAMQASKQYTFVSHLLAIDVHRTLTPLSYPPHTVALACLYLTSFLVPNHKNSVEWRGEEVTKEIESFLPRFEEGWCSDFESIEEDVEEIAHSILNLFIQLCPPTLSSTPSKPSPTYSPSLYSTSPSDVSINQQLSTRSSATGAQSEKASQLIQSGIPHTLSASFKSLTVSNKSEENLTKIKIKLREVENLRSKSKSDKKKNGKNGKGSKSKANKREAEDDELSQESAVNHKKRVERWKGGEEGLEEVKRKTERLENGEAEEKKPVSVRYQF